MIHVSYCIQTVSKCNHLNMSGGASYVSGKRCFLRSIQRNLNVYFRFHNIRLRVKFITSYNYPGTKFLTFGAKSLGGLYSQYFQT